MKQALSAIFVIFAFGQFCYMDVPWWTVAPLAAVAGWLFPQSAGRSFLSGFTGGFLLWLVGAWWFDVANGQVLSHRVGLLFMGQAPLVILLITGLLGGLLGGLGCLTGRWARDLVIQPAKTP